MNPIHETEQLPALPVWFAAETAGFAPSESSGMRPDLQTLQDLLREMKQTQEELRGRVHALEAGLTELRNGMIEAAAGFQALTDSDPAPSEETAAAAAPLIPRSKRHPKPERGFSGRLFGK